jgi:hypothetical protein
LTTPEIQRHVANCFAKETIRFVMKDLDGECFAILANESSGVYQNERLALCLQYVDKQGKGS